MSTWLPLPTRSTTHWDDAPPDGPTPRPMLVPSQVRPTGADAGAAGDRRAQPFFTRHARSNGSRQALGAISWWMALGPQLPGG